MVEKFAAEIASGTYLHYNAFSNQFLLLNQEKHDLYHNNLAKILNSYPLLSINSW